IVSHHEQGSSWYRDRPHTLMLRAPGKTMDDVRLIGGAVIHVELAVANLHHIAADSHHALQEYLFGIPGITENHDVATMNGFKSRQAQVDQRNLRTIERFVEKQMIADQDRAFHRARRYNRRLADESPNAQRDDAGDQQSPRRAPPELSR